MQFSHLRESLRLNLWFVPSLCVLGAIVLAVISARIDRSAGDGVVEFFSLEIDAESARSFLSALSSSMITLTALVFSITILVLQLASNQFSPRVLRTFLRDRHSQFSLGIFVATFTYSMLVLREVRGAEAPGGAHVPELSVTLAFGLVFLSLAAFVAYIHHVASSIRVSTIVDSIGDETRRLIREIYDHDRSIPARRPLPEGPPLAVIRAPREGVITLVDRDGLAHDAQQADCVLSVVHHIGDFVPYGGPLVEVHGASAPDASRVLSRIDLQGDRTMQQDPTFGFRQLVDIAERSLSPAVNDPTTAVEVLNQLHDLLRRIAARPFPTGQRLDREGTLRLIYPVVTWDAYVHLAVDEIRQYGATSLQVMRRLRGMLEDLMTVALDERKAVLEQELRDLEMSVERSFPSESDRQEARAGDGRPVA